MTHITYKHNSTLWSSISWSGLRRWMNLIFWDDQRTSGSNFVSWETPFYIALKVRAAFLLFFKISSICIALCTWPWLVNTLYVRCPSSAKRLIKKNFFKHARIYETCRVFLSKIKKGENGIFLSGWYFSWKYGMYPSLILSNLN